MSGASWGLSLCILLLVTVSAQARTLSEREVVRLALERSVAVQSVAVERAIAATALDRAKALFDTGLRVKATYTIDRSDRSIPVFGTDNREMNLEVGATRTLPSGTRLTLDWKGQRISTDSAFATVNPYVDAGLALTIAQPLLKDWLGRQERGGVAVARAEVAAAEAAAGRRIGEAVAAVVVDYWAWLAQRELGLAAQRSWEEAGAFERLTAWRRLIGRAEATDLLAARAHRMQFETLVVETRRLEVDALQRLQLALALDPADPVTSRQGLRIARGLPDRTAALSRALAARGDYQALRHEAEAKQLAVALANDRRRPTLDLIGSLRFNGINSGWGASLGEVGAADHPQVAVGGQFAWSVENRAARSDAARATHEQRKLQLQVQAKEDQIRREVDAGYRKVVAAMRTVALQRGIEALHEEKWQVERERYRTGLATSDFVIRYLEDYLAARRATIAALLEARVARTELRLAQGTLVEDLLGGGE